MGKMLFRIRALTFILLTLLLFACGGGGGNSPSLSISMASVTFEADQSTGSPNRVTVTGSISNLQRNIFIGIFYTDDAISNVTYQTLSQSSAQITIYPKNPSSLSVGIHHDTIQVFVCYDANCNSQVDGSPKLINVTYTVTADLAVDVSALEFNYVTGMQSLPPTQPLLIMGQDINWEATSDSSWLNLTPAAGITPKQSLVGVGPQNLGVGVHNGLISVVNVDDPTEQREVMVSLTILPPEIITNNSSLTFQGVLGTSLPGQFVSHVLNNDDDVPFSYEVDADWIIADSTTQPGGVFIQVDPSVGSLVPGAHQGTVKISGTSFGVPVEKIIPVNLTLLAPKIVASQSSVQFSGTIGTSFSGQFVALSLDNADNIPLSFTPNKSWIVIDDTSQVGGIIINVDTTRGGLDGGQYQGSVTVSGVSFGIPVQTVITVNLATQAPTILTSQYIVNIAGINGATLPAQFVSVGLDNGDNAPLNYVANENWILLDESSQTGGITIQVDPSIAMLSSGMHQGSISISAVSFGVNVQKTIYVNLDLRPASFIFQESTLNIGGLGGENMTPQTLNVSFNTGDKSYAWTATFESDVADWLQADISSGISSSVYSLMSVYANYLNLTPGYYNGRIQFSANINGDVITDEVPVSLTKDSQRLLVDDNGLSFSSFPTTSTLSHVTKVTDTYGAVNILWNASSDQSWLSVTASGLTGDDLVVTADPAGLASDTLHLATVTIQSTSASIDGAETIRVGLWVSSSDLTVEDTAPVVFSEVASDQIRPYAYFTNGLSDIFIYNVHTGLLVNTIANVGAALGDLVVSTDGSTLWVVDESNAQVLSVNLDTYEIGSPIYLEAAPFNSRIGYARPKGKELIFGPDGKIYSVSDQVKLDQTFNIGSYERVFSPLSTTMCFLYVCKDLTYSYLTGQATLSSNRYMDFNYTSCGDAADVAISEDGNRVYIGCTNSLGFVAFDIRTGQRLLALSEPGTLANNIEAAPNGLIIGGARIHPQINDPEVWVYNSEGVLQTSFTYSGGIGSKKIAVSSDSRRVIILGGAVYFSTIDP